jgi:hypothetical protein
MNQLGQFEKNLLTELREVVAERTTAQPRRALPRRRLALATAGSGLLATGLLVGLPALNGDQTQAAYAVVTNDDGTVALTIIRPDDAEGLERELAEHGITAEVDSPPPGKMCQNDPPRFTVDETWPYWIYVKDGAPQIDDFDGWTLGPANFQGQTLVIEIETDTDNSMSVIAVADGPVAPCVLVDRP